MTMTKMRSGNADPIADSNRAAEAWAAADPRAVVIAAASDDGQAALRRAAEAFADKGKDDKARAVADVAKLAGVGAHLSALADRVAQQSFGGSAALARTVAEEMRRGLKLDGLSIPAVVELLQTTAAGGGWTALAVLHALLPRGANTRRDPILPRLTISAASLARERGELIVAPEGRAGLRTAQMPLFPEALHDDVHVPLLDLADVATGERAVSTGRGAAHELRLLFEGVTGIGVAVPSATWIPGLTRRPVPGVGGLWIGNASRYPVFSARDRRRIAFGPVSTHRPGAIDAAWHKAADAAGIVILDKEAVDRDGKRGWIVVPAAAAKAIRKATK